MRPAKQATHHCKLGRRAYCTCTLLSRCTLPNVWLPIPRPTPRFNVWPTTPSLRRSLKQKKEMHHEPQQPRTNHGLLQHVQGQHLPPQPHRQQEKQQHTKPSNNSTNVKKEHKNRRTEGCGGIFMTRRPIDSLKML